MKYPTSILIMILTVVLFTFLLTVFSPSERAGDSRQVKSEAPHTDAPALTMNVSAYCTCELCCSPKWADGFTASGKPAVGRICAAPPEYPFGSKLHIEGYGEYTVEDRGSAIIGNKLDLLFPTHQAALNFGRKKLLVKVIK